MVKIADAIKPKTLAAAILLLIGGGALAVTALMAPGVLQALKPLIARNHKRKYYERERIRTELRRLKKRRLVDLYQHGDDLFIKITENGKSRLRKLSFDNLLIPRMEHWDRKWRVVIFDIPEKYKRSRWTFQSKLKDLGFYPLQKSVFVFPFDCRDEVDFLTSFCEIKPFVHYLETNDLDGKEGDGRKFFNLL